MATMSDDGERACPLCAEEMDLTDQQLKPCKCGYEICVWCWHHIMEMAEKEDAEGRCPACRTPYDKERIAGTAGNCERVVAELNAEKKQKSLKAKVKPSLEARKHLSSVRVIQRNLVYIIGLPSNLCDENLLERREYFGQYGRVLKVSISRPAGAAGQQASNNTTFSVYITYAREEEAVRCIQAVHNFVLEGKPLRACFGTTKYCHAWLRNLNCSNPDCMYLHDIGSQEDSFTKDEIISAYTRSRVPQVASNNAQKRSGNVLPSPPVDEIYNNGAFSGRQPVKNGPISNVGQSKVASNCSNGGKATGLPPAASWGLRVSNGRQPLTSSATSQNILKQKLESANASNVRSCSAWHDDVAASKLSEVGQLLNSDSSQRSMERTCSSNCLAPDEDDETSFDVCQKHITSAWDDDEFLPFMDSTKNNSKSVVVKVQSAGPVQQSFECATSAPVVSSMGSEIPLSFTSSPAPAVIDMAAGTIDLKNSAVVKNDPNRRGFGSTSASLFSEFRAIEGLSSGLSSLNVEDHLHADKLEVASTQSSDPMLDPGVESVAMLSISPSITTDADASGETFIVNSEPRSQGQQLSANCNGDMVVVAGDHKHRLSNATLPQMWSSCSSELPSTASCDSKSSCTIKLSAQAESTSFFGSQTKSNIANGHRKDDRSSMSQGATKPSDVNYSKEKANLVEIFDNAANYKKSATVDMGECGVISDILSLDFDPWDDSLSGANNFARLLGETGIQDGSFKQSNSWKSQSSKESRFSFARQDSEGYTLEPAIHETGHAQSLSSSSQVVYGDRFSNGLLSNGFGSSSFTGPTSSDKHGLSDRFLGTSKSKIQAPPGFSVPNRAPPPGFSTQERYLQGYGGFSDHLVGDSPLRNPQQFHPSENTGDVEFIDPAILAVGKGRLPLGVNNSGFNLTSPFPTQFNSFESDPRLQLLMQQSISTQPDLRFSEHPGNRVLPINDSYSSSTLIAQNNGISSFGRMTFQHPRSLQMSTNQWDSWSDIRTANDLGLSENMRNDSFGLSNYFQGNEERKFHMTSPGNLYNRAFGL